MRKIAAVTGTRAEYGLLYWTMKRIQMDDGLELQLIVTGSHLSSKYGNTIEQIKEDGFKIDEEIEIDINFYKKSSISKSMGLEMIQMAQGFERLKPDMLLVLGDRYEVFAAAVCAMTMNIPIAHISGGEITEGAIDEQIRHAITKMAHIHFPGAECYAENIKKMGEESWRIFNVGDPGIENIKNTKLMTKEEIKEDLDIDIDEETLLITYHPVTLEIEDLPSQISNLLEALSELDKKMIITYPNADYGNDYIIKELNKFSKENNNVYLFKNLGNRRYLSIMKNCGVVVGNSSSALVEAPYLKVPVVDIGNRQKGRLKAENIISCSNDSKDIINAINKSLSSEFKEKVKNVKSLYGEGSTSEEIVKVLKQIDIDDKLLKKKLVWR
jgi:GDP/UDP-N,N'-diacetylbacillosamine 2-epimerase (hydrolysing)